MIDEQYEYDEIKDLMNNCKLDWPYYDFWYEAYKHKFTIRMREVIKSLLFLNKQSKMNYEL